MIVFHSFYSQMGKLNDVLAFAFFHMGKFLMFCLSFYSDSKNFYVFLRSFFFKWQNDHLPSVFFHVSKILDSFHVCVYILPQILHKITLKASYNLVNNALYQKLSASKGIYYLNLCKVRTSKSNLKGSWKILENLGLHPENSDNIGEIVDSGLQETILRDLE